MDPEKVSLAIIAGLSALGSVGAWLGNLNSKARRDLVRLRRQDVAWRRWDWLVQRAWAERGHDPADLPAKDPVLTDGEESP